MKINLELLEYLKKKVKNFDNNSNDHPGFCAVINALWLGNDGAFLAQEECQELKHFIKLVMPQYNSNSNKEDKPRYGVWGWKPGDWTSRKEWLDNLIEDVKSEKVFLSETMFYPKADKFKF